MGVEGSFPPGLTFSLWQFVAEKYSNTSMNVLELQDLQWALDPRILPSCFLNPYKLRIHKEFSRSTRKQMKKIIFLFSFADYFFLFFVFLFLFDSSTSWFRSLLLQQVPKPEQAEFPTESPQKAALGLSKSKVLFALNAEGNFCELWLLGWCFNKIREQ